MPLCQRGTTVSDDIQCNPLGSLVFDIFELKPNLMSHSEHKNLKIYLIHWKLHGFLFDCQLLLHFFSRQPRCMLTLVQLDLLYLQQWKLLQCRRILAGSPCLAGKRQITLRKVR